MSDKYDVGYGKPPTATRFQRGQSGNPRGRAKGSKNLGTLVMQAFSEKVVVNINGRRKRISKLEAAFTQQANKAAAGDPKAVRLMLDVLDTEAQREAAERDGRVDAPELRQKLHQQTLVALRARMTEEEPDHEL